MKPLAIYDLFSIANWSFEEGVVGNANVPSWQMTSGSSYSNATDSVAQSAGDGLPSTKSARLSVTASNGRAVIRQRFSLANLPSFMFTDTPDADTPRLAVGAMFRPSDALAAINGVALLRLYSSVGSSSLPGSGAEITSGFEQSRVEHGSGAWSLRVTSTTLPTAAVWVDLELCYDPARGGYSAVSKVWWDRVFLGRLLDLDRGFAKWEVVPDNGFEVAIGDGAVEAVRVRGVPTSKVKCGFANVYDGSPDAKRIAYFRRWMAAGAGRLALWRDRTLFTNEEDHYQALIPSPSFTATLEKGVARRSYEWEFTAYTEGL